MKTTITEWVVSGIFIALCYLLILFVTASFVNTHNGPVRWDKGREAVLEFLGGTDKDG